MPSALILYSSIDGHTIVICQRLQTFLSERGHAVWLQEIRACDEALLRAADLVVIGASIRYGRHRPCVAAFMRQHQTLLEGKAHAFFSVNVVARKAAKNQPDTNPYLRKFLHQIGWRPALLDVFAGRIDYPRCSFIDRQMIRLIMWITKGPTDPLGVFEFTDWRRVEEFGQRLATQLEVR
ncbi:menaquinone-dependent protoporphyrinogen IX dehydrogenase [Uliginosibacterium sp. 31-16]|uniref:menaquinone-dependent protoporphyrinogen IX dehydrogenase n=1 Tax=Uliginosibacterium sp. 31-16 TaxID=3068315 RepID=UPI00273F3359|nr:menaquinone-dependent protoporphyrinogen IX dehydrogenase [Uliginosibacterium sp. 31-16]MDP5240649.1 menaquinone-dependent protoporphyrinogen IX dehydrogenase [Uliginosibacterium sp. 31-16]